MIYVVIILATVTNALCDSWILRKPTVSWWQWHIPKWVHFYGPIVVLMYYRIPFGWIWGVLALVCWVLWKVSYKIGEKIADQ